jgi:hypothetical protein
VTGKKKSKDSSHKFGPYTLMALNHKKGLEQGASSLILKVNAIFYPLDLSLSAQTISSSMRL